MRAFLAAILIVPIICFAVMTKPWAAEHCIASVYTRDSSSPTTASGERLDESALTAAHKNRSMYPFGSKARVTNMNNGRSVVVRINDAGPFIRGRCIDVTPAGQRALGMGGTAPVKVEKVQ